MRWSFCGSPSEIERAEQVLLSVDVNSGICGELIRVAMDEKIEIEVRVAALLRVIKNDAFGQSAAVKLLIILKSCGNYSAKNNYRPD